MPDIINQKQINIRIIKLKCISAPRSWSHVNNTVVLTILIFLHIQCLHLMYVCWGSLGTSVFGNSSSAANNTRSTLPCRLSFRFFWLWFHAVNSSYEYRMHFCSQILVTLLQGLFVHHLKNELTLWFFFWQIKHTSQFLSLSVRYIANNKKFLI